MLAQFNHILLVTASLVFLIVPWKGYCLPFKKVASTSLASDEIIVDLISKGLLGSTERPEFKSELKNYLRLSTFAADPEYSYVAEFAKRFDLAQLSSNNLEELVSFQPDRIVMANFNHPGFVSKIKSLKSKMLVLDSFETIADIRSNILSISKLIDRAVDGQKLLKDFDRELEAVKGVLGKPTTFLVYVGGLSFPGGKTLIDSMLKHIGGVNLVSKSKIDGFKTVSREWLMLQRPDFIVVPLNKDSIQEKNIALNGIKSLKPLETMIARGSKVVFLDKKGLWSTSHHLAKGIRNLAIKVCKLTPCSKRLSLAQNK